MGENVSLIDGHIDNEIKQTTQPRKAVSKMTNKKLTDNEIKKALECCCKNNNCEGCPLDYLTFSSQCASELAIKSLDLINRLQTQNKDLAETIHNLTLEKDALFDKAEELKAEVEKLNKEIQITKDAYTMLQTKIEIINSKAVKEFAERLKDSFFDNGYESPDVDFDYFVDNLLKEMVGDDNA